MNYDCPLCFDTGPHEEEVPTTADDNGTLVLICRRCGGHICTGEKVGP